MPKKIRQLESELKKAGFVWEPGKGSHRKWSHSSGVMVVISGQAGDDAKFYQEKLVKAALEEAKAK